VKLFDKKILDYDYGDDEDEMLNQSPVFQQQQHQSTSIEGIDRFVCLIFFSLLNYKHTENDAIIF